MPKPTSDEIQKRFKSLPQDLKDAIFSIETADVIQALGKKYKLTIDKIGELADEAGYLMMGFTDPKNFLDIIQKRLSVDFETARAVTEDLNIQIFGKIRESLKHARMREENYVVPVPPRLAEALREGGPRPSEAPPHPPSTTTLAPRPPEAPSMPRSEGGSPFESKLEEKVFSAQKELSEAKQQNRYPGDQDPYREPIK